MNGIDIPYFTRFYISLYHEKKSSVQQQTKGCEGKGEPYCVSTGNKIYPLPRF